MSVRIITGDALASLRELPAESVQCCVTSPPYWGLRDYGVAGQLGLEATPAEYVANMVEVFREVRRVLRDDGTLWLNLGDSYATSGGGAHKPEHANPGISGSAIRSGVDYTNRKDGLKPKDLIGIPWRVAFALQADGWWLRSDIIWEKPNPMPESVTDRPTKAHEYVFLMAKSERYHYDAEAIREPWADDREGSSNTKSLRYSEQSGRNGDSGLGKPPPFTGRNARSVWSIATQPFKGAHFATFPPKLAERCILAGCPVGGMVLDPFGGAGTVGLVADRLGRGAVLIEINPEYAAMAGRRIHDDSPLFSGVSS